MNDKERIEHIITQKGMSNSEFASITGIAPATISHITSGRSNPTLAVFKGIINAFPDLNPTWVLLGMGDMYYRTEDGTVVSSDAPATDKSASQDLFSQNYDENKTPRSSRSRKNDDPMHSPIAPSTAVTIESTIRNSFANLASSRKRQIVEVRIFFDDGTYEAFCTPK